MLGLGFRSMISAALLSAGAFACGEDVTGPESPSVQTDYEVLRSWVEREGSFSPAARSEALSRIGTLDSGQPVAAAAHFLNVASVVALADNGHSNVDLTPIRNGDLLPIGTFWFEDGLHIVRAKAGHEALLGGRIDSIGGRSIQSVEETLSTYHGGTREHFRQFFADPLMLSPPVLHAAGICDCTNLVRLSLTLPGGGTRSVELRGEAAGTDRARVAPWVRLVRSPLPGESSQWAWVPYPPELPLYLDDTTRPFRYERIPGYDAVYLQLRTNADLGGESLSDWVSNTRQRLMQDSPRHLVLDNRFNAGGNLTLTADFGLELPTLVPESGRVFVIVSNATFSAGIYTSFYPEASDSARTIVIGSRVGDRGRFWAESPGAVVLPQSGLRIGLSVQMHDLESGCDIPTVCHLAGSGPRNLSVGDLAPDVEVLPFYRDFAAGIDPALDRVREMMDGSPAAGAR